MDTTATYTIRFVGSVRWVEETGPVPLSTTEFKALLSTEGKRLSTLIKEQKIIVD